MHRILIGWLALLMAGTVMGQEVTARLDLDRRASEPQHIEYCAADGGLVTLGNMSRKSSRYLGVTKYDDLFNKQWTKQVLAQNGRANVDMMTVLGENIYVFISEYFPRDRSIKTSFSHFDLEGNMVAERKVISELPNVKEHRVDLNYTRSINKRKLLCYKNLANNRQREKVLYYLFDSEDEEVIKGEISIPYPDDKFSIRKLLVSNTGYIYVLGKYYLVNRIKTPDDYGFKVYRYRPGEKEGEFVDIELGDKFITDLTLKVDRNENMFLAGFYSNRNTSQIIGTCSFRLNPDMETEMNSTQRFSDEFLNNFLSDRQIDRGKELKNFFLDNIILRSDGGLVLIAEKYYTTYNSYTDIYGYYVDQRIYHYDDVIVNSVSAEGDLEWSTVARKRQASESRLTLSYLDVVSGVSLFLIYDYTPRRAPHTIYYSEVDFEGNVGTREMLIKSNSGNDSFFPRMSEQISNDEALLVYFQERSKVFSIVKISFAVEENE